DVVDPLDALLVESAAPTLLSWLAEIRHRRRPPVLVTGSGAEELARGIVAALLKAGRDALVAPWTWLDGDGAPDVWPELLVVLPGLEEVTEDVLEQMSARTSLMVAGDVVPFLRGADSVLLDLPPERVEDLAWHDAAGWPA
ncbi:MAG: hypothetical protein KAI24_19875, partial [Planctomycetes bacterium]|nr:hypothetical protein [Planctomycetota bacterium]